MAIYVQRIIAKYIHSFQYAAFSIIRTLYSVLLELWPIKQKNEMHYK